MSNDLARIEANMAALDVVAQELALVNTDISRSFSDSLRLALASKRVSELLTDEVMTVAIMPLKGKGYGFLSDEDARMLKGQGPYPLSTVRDVMIEAVMRGIRPTGNELNIIGGRFYMTKNGCKRKVKEFPGMTDLTVQLGVPKMGVNGALVDAVATYKLNGEIRKVERTGQFSIPVRVNAGQGADAVLGKADRKMRAYILELLTGSEQSVLDIEDAHESASVSVGNMKPVEGVEIDISQEGQPEPAQQAQPVQQTRSEDVKQAMNAAAVTRAKADKKPRTGVTPPPQQAAPAPAVAEPAPAQTAPAPQQTAPAPATSSVAPAAAARAKDFDEKLLKKAETVLDSAKKTGLKVSFAIPVIVAGVINHPSLNPDGSLREELNHTYTPTVANPTPAAPAAAATAPQGTPTTGTPVTTKGPKSVGAVNGKKIYRKADGSTTENITEAAGYIPPGAMQSSNPAPAMGPASQVAPAPEPTGEIETFVAALANVKMNKQADGSFIFKVTDDRTNVYETLDKKAAVIAKELWEKKIPRVVISYIKQGDKYILVSTEEEVAPVQGEPVDEDFGSDLDIPGDEQPGA